MSHMRNMIVHRLLPILLILLIFLPGCSGEKEVTFYDLSITLPAGFSRDTSDGDPEIEYYTSVSGVQVMLQRITYTSLIEQEFSYPQNLTAQQFRELIIESNSYDATLRDIDGIPAFVHEFKGYNGMDPNLGNEMYKSLCCIFKNDSAMWIVDFGVPSAHYDQWEESFLQWAKTIQLG